MPIEGSYSTKKCPECFAYMELDANQCSACKTRVGAVNKNGMARRLVNWKAYLFCLVAWLLFGLYVWKVFLQE